MSICSVWGPPRAGKTTLAVNLAYGISRTEHSVCLISPLEFSEYSALFGTPIPEEKSLTAALRDGSCTRTRALKVTEELYILASPASADAFGCSFSDESIQRVLLNTESTFDYVVVDCLAQAGNLFSAWAMNRSSLVLLLLGCTSASPLWHSANRRAVDAIAQKIMPVEYRASSSFDYEGLDRLLERTPETRFPYLAEANALQNDGRFPLRPGSRAARTYYRALNEVFGGMQP